VASVDEKLANDSDSDEDCVLEISNSAESDDENDISDSGLGPSVDGFCEKIVNEVFHSSQEIQRTICCSKWNRYGGIC
jgi:hypothetical protein